MREVVDPGVGESVEEIETALLRQEWVIAAAVPFADNAGAVAGVFKALGDGDFTQVESLSHLGRRGVVHHVVLVAVVGDVVANVGEQSVAERIPAREQRASGGAADRRADVEIRHAEAFGCHAVRDGAC
jgi:hypothetical protein